MQTYISIFMFLFSGGGLLFFGSQIPGSYAEHEGMGIMVALMAIMMLVISAVELVWVRGIRRDRRRSGC